MPKSVHARQHIPGCVAKEKEVIIRLSELLDTTLNDPKTDVYDVSNEFIVHQNMDKKCQHDHQNPFSRRENHALQIVR